ncbi:RNA-directed DNA polymerase, eukaryota [Tanacetum coccineum]
MDVKYIWGNSNYQFVSSDSIGNSGGILCIWEASVFKKEFVTISDNFVAIYGSWCSNNSKLLIVVVYAPQSSACKRLLWEYISSLITRWNGETIVMGDFNVVRSTDERLGSRFNQSSAKVFNQFIESSGLVDIKLEGYSFTWSHPSGRKMSKLDRFLVSEGIVSLFPSISATCLDKHLSDHRPILLHEVNSDFGPSPFRMFHSWFRRDGFDLMVEQAWCSFSHNDGNSLIRFKKKLQALKIIIRRWIKSKNLAQSGIINSIKEELIEIDKIIDSGSVNDELLLKRMDLSRQLFDTKYVDSCDSVQKSKIKWGIEGDENSKYFHGIINKKRSLLAIRGVLVDGDWCIDPGKVKDVFMQHFAARFKKPNSTRFKLNFVFPNRLSDEQVENMDQLISRDEIKSAVWSCGENKSPGPDGYTFEFFRRYWNFIGPDLCSAVECFFDKGSFPMGNNASFIALIPKVPDAKYVTDYRPISLIGSVYKVITKVLANRLATVVSDLVSDTQSAFVANRQILDGPFILNEVLTWCKRKRKQAMIFKVYFAKAYDSVRWDYLMEVLQAFGFGPNWCKWVWGTLSSAMASVLINGSPSKEFAFYRGLKQGDPLAPFLFILVMESLHLSFTRTVNEGLFTGLQLNESMTLSHHFYADDVVFIGEWSDSNMENIVIILKSFFLASGLKINIQKSHIMGVGVADGLIHQAASLIGCAIMKTPFRYLGVLVGNNSLRCSAWSDTIHKLRSRLSKWKVKTLSVGGRLTLLKSVLGASPIYNLSIYKAPITVLKEMERIRSNFFKGADYNDRKISWVSWDKVLASKKVGGLGVSSYYALNRALILKWVWRFVSQDGSLWFRVIQALYGTSLESHQVQITSLWSSILREMHVLVLKGFDLMAHCKKRIGDGNNTSFWRDSWIGDHPLCLMFPRIFVLEKEKEITVASKLGLPSVDSSFRRQIRDGIERQQWMDLISVLDCVILSPTKDRWICDLNGDGLFRVKDIRSSIDSILLPSDAISTRWVKYVPIKINVFVWRARLDRLPTRVNLDRRGVIIDSVLCPLCGAVSEDISHVLFRCDLASRIFRRICRWWELDSQDLSSFADWDVWFSSIRRPSKSKAEEVEEREKMVRKFWNVYTYIKMTKLTRFWQEAFEAAYKHLATDVAGSKDATISEIARMSLVSVDVEPSSLNSVSGGSRKSLKCAFGRRNALPPTLNDEVNVEKALDSFLKGATRGSKLAMLDTGLVYWEIGNKDEGVRMYKRATELGDPVGQCNFGISYLQGWETNEALIIQILAHQDGA